MLTPTQITQIEAQLRETQERVCVLNIEGTQIFIKRQEAARNSVRYKILKTCAKMFREPLLTPANVLGGAYAQQTEALRLTQLNAVDASVPELLHVAPDWIAMSYLGGESFKEASLRGQQKPSYYFEKAIAAILDTHQKGQNLSQCFVRNMMWHNDRPVFIDFEDDPAQYMPLAVAQGRDYMYFLFSSLWMLEITPTQTADLIWSYLKQESDDVRNAVCHAGQTIGWLRYLPKNRDPWGRDVMAMHAWGKVLYELRQKNRLEYAQ